MNAPRGSTPERVAILGAGPIGLACALLLSARGIASRVVDARSLEQACGDRRLLALSRGTLQLLAGLLGDGFAPMAPILEVVVSSRGQFGATRMSSRDFGDRPLGATVWYADLVHALARAAQADPNILVQRPCRVLSVEQHHDAVRVHVQDAAPFEASLAVNAEGSPIDAGEAAGAGSAKATPPEADALLADVEVDGMRSDTAIERFTREGPLALLPVPAGAKNAAIARKSMIWCLDHDLAEQRFALGDVEFARKIQATIGPRIGYVTSVGPRSRFPLFQQRRPRLREHRLVYIGNAAQSLHPVAGQGFNLGMRDGACLAECLAQQPNDPPEALKRYENSRKADRFAISRFTSALPGVFASSSAPISAARSVALTAFDLARPLRRSLSSILMFGVRR
jgi:2-octaprenyl-6-methoxyphenol hydroxylase